MAARLSDFAGKKQNYVNSGFSQSWPAGVGGACALIVVTSWTQLMLASHRAPKLSAAVFTGPGIGITLTGLLAWGVAACGLTALQAWSRRLPSSLPSAAQVADALPFDRDLKALLLAYTLTGFGYILPATFLS
ncbi:MFS transporter [Candidatus Pantoea persica]|uniref:MFS transporter n=1 Tax=Candidatus Pantoea persica TaxID=2518128 RepID=UPI00215D8B96|nr:MFS transporter [Candidatus Pantoea persica]MBA2814036.1 MFS transporter [Candidatus Pantoea persica]